MKIQNMGSIITIILFCHFTALTTSTNLCIDAAGYPLAKRAAADDCVESCFICLQYLPNHLYILFTNSFSLYILFTNSLSSTNTLPLKQYETFII